MSTNVHAILDQLTPSLHTLRSLTIFTPEEISKIVKERERSEWLLSRRSVRRSDFENYLEREKMLERLHKIRRQKVFNSKSSTVSPLDRNEGIGCIVQHIHFIYDRFCRKFGRGDVKVWFEFIDFCQSVAKEKYENDESGEGTTDTTGQKKISKIFAQAIQLHPLNAKLWISAASFEGFTLGNFSSARGLLQRGLRVNDGVTENKRTLWRELVRLELAACEVAKGRKVYAKKRKRGTTGEDVDGVSFDLTVVDVVLKNALAQCKDLNFYADMLSLLGTDFKHVDDEDEDEGGSLTNRVLEAIQALNDTGVDPFIVRAEFEMGRGGENEAFKILKEAMKANPTAEGFTTIANFVYDILVDTAGEGAVGKKAEKLYDEVLRSAQKKDVVDSTLCLMIVEHLGGCQEGSQGRKVVEDFFSSKGGVGSTNLWTTYAQGAGELNEKRRILRRGIEEGVKGLKKELLASLLGIIDDDDDDDDDDDRGEEAQEVEHNPAIESSRKDIEANYPMVEELIMGGVTDEERGELMRIYFRHRATVDTVKFGLKKVCGGPGMVVFYSSVLNSGIHLDTRDRREVWEYIVINTAEGEMRNEVLSKWETEEQASGDFNFAAEVGGRRKTI